MNKRTILFVLLVSVSFLGLNIFFSSLRDKKDKEFAHEEEANRLKNEKAYACEIEKKTIPLSELPLVTISSDQEGKSTIANAVQTSDALLTLAWAKPLPEKVYLKGNEYTLLTKDFVKEGPVVYGSKNFKSLSIAALPPVGSFELQLVTFDECQKANVYFAEYRDGIFSLPLKKPTQNGIALHKSNSTFLPFGFYDWRGNLLVEMQNLPIIASLPLTKPEEKVTKKESQKYFVLENAYMQLVLSNVGGAVSEINLPFETKENHLSVVKEIGFDRELAEKYPQETKFPSHPYFTADSKVEKTPEQVGGYYPLLRRKGTAPEFFALNTISDYPEMANLTYEVKEFTSSKIVLEALQSFRKIRKTYELTDAPYTFDFTLNVEGDSRGLSLTSGVPEVEIMSNASSPQVQYRITRKGKGEVAKLDLPKEKEIVSVSSISPDWIVNSNGYLGVILNPLQEGLGYKVRAIPGTSVPTRLSLLDPQYEPYPASKYPGYEVLLPLPTKSQTLNYRVYAGPFEEMTLNKVDAIYTDPQTKQNPEYSESRTFYGWFSFISEPFAKFLFIVMKFFYMITHSWAFSIILLTVFLRILLYPLNAWSIKSMQRMRDISPEVQGIQKKYKKEPKKAQMEIMALYREKKVNPMSGCLPILIQLPFLIGMFDLLKSSFQLRGASFIPGWIDNLTAPDVLFEWTRPIFFIGTQFHLLPIILGVVMFLQQRMSSPTRGKTELTDQERQQKAMGTIMSVVFMVMFYHFPSGLNIYWLSSMLLGMLQQWLTNKYSKKSKVEVVKAHLKR